MNDPEIIESLKYLLIPQAEKIKAQAQPFDGKKSCWIPEHKEGFIAAEIVSTKGEEVTVKTSKGEVCSVSFSACRLLRSHGTHTSLLFNSSECHRQEGRYSANEPAKVRSLRRYGWLDLLERCVSLVQLARALQELVYLCKCPV